MMIMKQHDTLRIIVSMCINWVPVSPVAGVWGLAVVVVAGTEVEVNKGTAYGLGGLVLCCSWR